MGAYGYDGTLVLEIIDRGDGGTDTRIVGDGFAVEGDVEIAADEDFFALEVGFG